MPVVKQRPFPGNESDRETVLRLGAALAVHFDQIPSEVLQTMLIFQATMFDLEDDRSHAQIRNDIEAFIQDHKAGKMEEEVA
ncbi:hypothetical protein MKK50_17985 [Methylobacterium sp. J-043]|nr:hypothetical protein [Methylobacterium sp. J-043]